VAGKQNVVGDGVATVSEDERGQRRLMTRRACGYHTMDAALRCVALRRSRSWSSAACRSPQAGRTEITQSHGGGGAAQIDANIGQMYDKCYAHTNDADLANETDEPTPSVSRARSHFISSHLFLSVSLSVRLLVSVPASRSHCSACVHTTLRRFVAPSRATETQKCVGNINKQLQQHI